MKPLKKLCGFSWGIFLLDNDNKNNLYIACPTKKKALDIFEDRWNMPWSFAKENNWTIRKIRWESVERLTRKINDNLYL